MAVGNIVYSTSSTTIVSGQVINSSNFERSTNLQVDTTTGNLNIAGSVNAGGGVVASGTSNLGSVGSVKITGGSNGQVLTTDGSGNLSWASGVSFASVADVATGTSTTLSVTPSSLRGGGVLAFGTPQSPASGTTTINFTVPTWVSRITLTVYELSMTTTGASLLLRLGVNGVVETTGYYGVMSYVNGGGGAGASSWGNPGSAMVIGGGDNASGIVYNGSAILTRLAETTDVWVLQSIITDRVGEVLVISSAGNKSLSGRINTFQVLISSGAVSSGTMNVRYE